MNNPVMILGIAVLLLLTSAASAGAELCGSSGIEQSLIDELNASRRAAGQEAVAPHPVLCEIARDEAGAVAARGGTPTQAEHINSITLRLYRSRYAPHSWTEGSLITTSTRAIFDQWRSVRPEWCQQAESEDFEHVGVGLARMGERLVVTLVLALKTRTVEWRQAKPLEDRLWVQEVALAETNRLRAEAGKEPLAYDSQLADAAQRHAEDLLRREYYTHDSPEGDEVKDRARAAGFRGRLFAENLAKGLFTPDEVVRRWMNSSGHRRNILHRRLTHMGMGVAVGVNRADEFEVVWVQVFAAR
ncbi:MAG: CAP domain-containing protein [Acidobacteriota bacterium]